MHANIYQISPKLIAEELDQYTLTVGEGCHIDYCSPIDEQEREKAINLLLAYVLPKDMFSLLDSDTLVYKGGFEQWWKEYIDNLSAIYSKIRLNDSKSSIPFLYDVHYIIDDPLGCGEVFYLENDENGFNTSSKDFMFEVVSRLKPGDKLHIGGIIDAHF